MTRAFPLDHPLQAASAEYHRAATDYDELATAGGEVATSLDEGMTDGGGLTGAAGEAVVEMLDELRERVGDLEPVGRSIAGVFGEHATALEQLETEVEAAMAQARDDWDQLLVNQDRSAEAAEARQRAQRHLQSAALSAAVDPTVVVAAQAELDDAARQLTAADTALDAAEAAFRAGRNRLEELAERERLLDRTTIEALDGVDLLDLRDPRLLERLGGALRQFSSFVFDGLTGGGPPGVRLPDIDLPGLPDWLTDVTDEAGERLTEFGRYLQEANARREERGGRFWWVRPGADVDAFFEDGAAAVGILGMGGELYHGDENGYCGGNHSCIVGVATPLGGAITLGHTVLYTPTVPQDHLIAHEQQHIHQYEEHGTVGFLTRAGLSFAVDVALGGDGYVDTHYEREGYYVQDNYAAGQRPSAELEVPDDYFHSDSPDDYNFGWWTDRPQSVKDVSAQITEWIWE